MPNQQMITSSFLGPHLASTTLMVFVAVAVHPDASVTVTVYVYEPGIDGGHTDVAIEVAPLDHLYL